MKAAGIPSPPFRLTSLVFLFLVLNAQAAAGATEIKQRLFAQRPCGEAIRRKDLLELFDTTPDLAGNDLDILRYSGYRRP